MNWNLEEAINYYRDQGAPQDQAMLIALLREVQKERGGGISPSDITTIATAYHTTNGVLLATIRRIRDLRLRNVHTLEICGGPNCGKHKALAKFARDLCEAHQIEHRIMSCMRQCGNGPNTRLDGVLTHQTTPEILQSWVEQWKGSSE